MYDRHESPRLNEAFKGYQGQDPQYAKFIFFGLDANFVGDIHENPRFTEVIEEVIDYLNDGVAYWQNNIRHHPFLSNAYKNESGYKYHYRFSKLGLTQEFADRVSFVELLHCPTYGNTHLPRLMELLVEEDNENYLREIDNVLFSANREKSVYIARGVYPKLYKIAKSFQCFTCLPKPQKFQRNRMYTISDCGNLKIYIITHFSDAISDAHLAEIRRTIQG